MASVSSTFTASGTPSSSLFVKGGETFRVALTNTWVGTVRLEESHDGGASYAVLESFSANASFTAEAKPYDRLIRLNCFVFTSGTVTYVFQNVTNLIGRMRYINAPIGSVAYGSVGTSTTPSATLQYMSDVEVTQPFTATGIATLQAATIGTDNIRVALYDATGKLLGSSAAGGVVTSGADAFLQVAFSPSPLNLTPGIYFIALQCNGTTTRFRTIATLTSVNVRAGTIASVFDTFAATIAVPTTFTADKGLYAYLY